MDSPSDDVLRLELTERGQRYVLAAGRTADGQLTIELNGSGTDGDQVAELSGSLPATDLGLLVDLVKLLKERCGEANKSAASPVEQQRLTHAAAYRGWTDEQDDELRQLASHPGASVKAIAATLERSEGAIRSRLRRLRDRGAAAPDGDRATPGSATTPTDQLVAG
ncbi:hypothetical protein [Nonomuraea fuscirosea]|uniref:hypothetical protein n=1 Tax=Nonomuraea fuscirosea TaxID=1291556 RepID=UPI000D0700F8|nr:hypothetical protein [Nonomuraea fuscirosea]